MPNRTRLLIAALLVLSACGQSAPSGEGTSSMRVRADASASPSPAPSQPLPPRPEATVRLAAFESCSDFLVHVQQEALEHVGPHGIQGGGVVFAAEVAQAESTASSGRAAATSPDHSRTNVQFEGVDEPDIVKTDGRRIFAVAGQHLHALSVSEGAAELQASVPLEGWSQELLLDGDRVLLVSGDAGIEPALSSHPDRAGAETVVVVFDVSDGIREVSRTTLEGSYVSARMVDGVVRIVLASRSDRLEFAVPQGPDDVDEAVRRNREIIESSSAADWIPDYVLRTPRGTERGKLSTCSTVHHPADFSGFGMTTVVTIDPASPVPRESAAVLGDASTVYASPESLYVASMAWPPSPTADVAPQDVLTQIHRFDITGGDQASYVASGEVAGSLLNQFSLDEHEGRLRVATTTGFGWEETSQSGVTILETSGSALVPVGAVAGLGLGERIYAVRFMGDLGYVVTFRQVDPLYVIDLSDPRDPRNVGELKIPGYSAYLHPVSEDRLLGVGQDATESGWTTGTQVSLFDVADPTRPTRLDMVSFEGGHSSVEYDHRAFLYWAPSDLAVIPLQIWGEQAPAFSGVVGVGVGDGLGELGRLSHDASDEDAYAGAILRSLVIGDRLFTVSELGIGWADLATFEARGFADFPRPPPPSPEPRPAPEDGGEDDGEVTPEPLPNPGL